MRIGELLLANRWVGWEPLALAIEDHHASGMRLCSYLVARGEVDFDDGSRALAQQHGVAAALRRHLERRDAAVAQLLPVSLARDLCALPLGRLGNGTLIVCVRDPSPAAHARLRTAVGAEIGLATAPALYVERLVRGAYPKGMSAEHDIPIEVDEAPPPVDIPAPVLDFELDIAVDVPAEAPVIARTRSRPLPVEIKVRPPTEASRDPLDATIAACRDIDELGWLLDVVMTYVGKRWRASLLFEVRDRRAVGVRGHGQRLKPTAIKTFVIDLDEPSLVRLARDERRMVDALPVPPSEDDSTIAASLLTGTPVAAPIAKGETIAYVLVVGDPAGRHVEDTEVDLGLLVEAMTDALARM